MTTEVQGGPAHSLLEFTKAGRNDYHLTCEHWVPRPLDEVFAFFADPLNLDRLTPPDMKFQLVTPQPIEMKPGVMLDYTLRVRGIPIRWRSEIPVWEPGVMFVDKQVRGPYRRWEHRHLFFAENDGTRIRDEIAYSVPLGGPIHWLIVKPDLLRVFRYRLEKMAELFGE
jgi:ligand-binding SRPBCC domain-containing protein